MASTPSEKAIALSAQLESVANALAAVKQTIDGIVDVYNNEGIRTIWEAMATAAVNADGTIGTPDGSPVLTNPITVGNIHLSSTKLVAAVVMSEAFQTFYNTTANLQAINDLKSV